MRDLSKALAITTGIVLAFSGFAFAELALFNLLSPGWALVVNFVILLFLFVYGFVKGVL